MNPFQTFLYVGFYFFVNQLRWATIGIGSFMKDVKITVMRKCEYLDLMEQYENPIEHTCDMMIGSVFISKNAEKPEGMCDAAWYVMQKYVLTLACGGGDFFDGWMKNKHSAMISCDDGFRPVSFYLETVD